VSADGESWPTSFHPNVVLKNRPHFKPFLVGRKLFIMPQIIKKIERKFMEPAVLIMENVLM
jgi:hypothetical protein